MQTPNNNYQREVNMKKKSLLAGSMLASVMLLQGCTATNETKEAVTTENSAISDDLRAVAYSIKKENEQLALLEQQKLKQEGAIAPVQQDIKITGELAKKMTVKWTGEVEPLLKMITKDMGYTVFSKENIDGKKPVVPKIIRINANNETAYAILKDIGWQLGAKTKIAVDRENKVVRLIYVSEY